MIFAAFALSLNTDKLNANYLKGNVGFGKNYTFLQLPASRADSGKTRRIAILDDGSLLYEVWNADETIRESAVDLLAYATLP